MILRFGDYEVDEDAYRLCCRGTPISLEPRVFELLAYLLHRSDRVVSKEELLAAVWSGEDVTESVLQRAILIIRRSLGDDGRRQTTIRTVYGRGYAFVAHSHDPEEQERCGLLMQLGEARLIGGDARGAREAFASAIEKARAVRAPELFARAVIAHCHWATWGGGQNRALHEWIAEGIERLGARSDALRSRLLSQWTGTAPPDADSGALEGASREALALARRVEDPDAEVLALAALHHALIGPKHYHERATVSEELVRVAKRSENPRIRMRAQLLQVTSLLETGNGAGLDRARRALDALAASHPHANVVPWRARVEAAIALMERRLRDAEKQIEIARRHGLALEDAFTEAIHDAQHRALRRERGEIHALAVEAEERLAAGARARIEAAALRAALGEVESVGAHLRTLSDRDLQQLREAPDGLACFAALARALSVWRDRNLIVLVEALLREHCHAHIVRTQGPIYDGPVAHPLGLLAAARGDRRRARRCLRVANERARHLGARSVAAQIDRDLASLGD